MASEVHLSAEAVGDIQELSPFHRGAVVGAIEDLRHQATTATRNPKPLLKPLEELPAAAWELRVGDHRVFYRVEDNQVARVFRVIFKGRWTSAEALRSGRKR